MQINIKVRSLSKISKADLFKISGIHSFNSNSDFKSERLKNFFHLFVGDNWISTF